MPRPLPQGPRSTAGSICVASLLLSFRARPGRQTAFAMPSDICAFSAGDFGIPSSQVEFRKGQGSVLAIRMATPGYGIPGDPKKLVGTALPADRPGRIDPTVGT